MMAPLVVEIHQYQPIKTHLQTQVAVIARKIVRHRYLLELYNLKLTLSNCPLTLDLNPISQLFNQTLSQILLLLQFTIHLKPIFQTPQLQIQILRH
jgi:hypothetical protein